MAIVSIPQQLLTESENFPESTKAKSWRMPAEVRCSFRTVLAKWTAWAKTAAKVFEIFWFGETKMQSKEKVRNVTNPSFILQRKSK